MRQERGVSLMGLIVTLAVLAFLGVMAAKLLPSYIEYFKVKKVLSAMEQGGDFNGSARDIRNSYDRRNAIEDIKSVQGSDLEVSKAAGETSVTATWSVKVPMVSNASACLDFTVTTVK
jgi:Tfp pilus assembly protein PilE